MGRKSKVSYALKLSLVQDYCSGRVSVSQISHQLSVGKTSVKRWIKSYRAYGPDGLKPSSKNQSYSHDTKIKAIEDYLTGKGSLEDIRTKYGLRSNSQLSAWIKKYNSYEEIKTSYSGGNLMTKGRKTTLDERIKIVTYCIEHNKNYRETSEKFSVSYQQVRNWTLKYEEHGVKGLEDRRGKTKPTDEMTELEKLQAENKLLKAKQKHLEMENIALKKLREIERRRG